MCTCRRFRVGIKNWQIINAILSSTTKHSDSMEQLPKQKKVMRYYWSCRADKSAAAAAAAAAADNDDKFDKRGSNRAMH